MLENDIQEESKSEKSVDEAQVSLMKELFGDAKKIFEKLKENPKVSLAFEAEKQRAVRQAVLAGLILAEFVPVVEKVDDVTKAISIEEKIKRIITEKGSEAAKVVKKSGLVKDLYPNIPSWFVSIFEAIDVAEVPLLGVVPEVIQFLVDGFYNTPRSRITIIKESVKTFKEVREQRRGQISQAKSVFDYSFAGT